MISGLQPFTRAIRPTNQNSSSLIICRATFNETPEPRAAPIPSTSEATAAPLPSTHRRSILFTVASTALTTALAPTTLAPSPASAASDNAAITASLGNYIKRKKLDRIDSYVAPLLASREQLIRVGRVMLKDPKSARQLLRSGTFSGLRASVRAVGEFTAERGAGKEAGKDLVNGFYKELEGLDAELRQAERSEAGVVEGDGARTRLDGTIAALDKLLATVPEDALQAGKRVMAALEAEASSAAQSEASPQELSRLEKLF